MKILVAEHETASRGLLSSLLAKWGYDVVAVSDGNDAWRVIQEQDNLPVAIVEWNMPGKDGVTLCKLIRNKQREGSVRLHHHPHRPVQRRGYFGRSGSWGR